MTITNEIIHLLKRYYTLYENGRVKTTFNRSCDDEDGKKFTCCDEGDDGGGDGNMRKEW